jgi:flavin-dependent dehydrogenase
MEHELTADVVIVGAGPLGLSLATDLNHRGLSVIVAEVRRFKHPNVKC